MTMTDVETTPRTERRYRWGFVLAVLTLAVALTGCLAAPGDTAQIQLVSSVTQDGWRYDFYRNNAYPCAISGYQTFLVGTKVGSDASAAKPLWVKMHGGGVGYFDATGTPRPASNKSEESSASLLGRVDGGLTADVMGAPQGFRVLVVSMCSHDLYAGANTPDANNPNTLPDGTPITTNGLLATKAAVQHTRSLFPTDDLFLHGGSAGSAGSIHMAWALQQQGIPPTGIIADSGILNQTWEQAQIDQALPCAIDPAAAPLITARWHSGISNPANQPDMIVADGRLTVPVMQVWNHGDHNVCGQTPMLCELRDGSTITIGSADCVHEPMRLAIEAQGASSRSANLAVCVDDPSRTGTCDRHVVTTSATAVNTDPAAPADYNAFVLDWVGARLADD
jgi:hypothetical protein